MFTRTKKCLYCKKHHVVCSLLAIFFLCQLILALHLLSLHLNDGKNVTKDQFPFEEITNYNKFENNSINPNKCSKLGKDAVYAIQRATTLHCKELIAEIACKSQLNSLYPMDLPNKCLAQENTALLGCFQSINALEIVDDKYEQTEQSNSPYFCIRLCLQLKYRFAALDRVTRCTCINHSPKIEDTLPNKICDFKCPGNLNATCGGINAFNIYKTQNDQSSIPFREHSTNKAIRIAFILTVSGRALRQIKRLLKIIYHSQNYYYIHVDVREDYLFRELLPLEQQFSNIRLARRRFATIWGGASLLKTLLTSMKQLLDWSDWHWDFVINLSESDYPVKLMDSLEQFLKANKDLNFVKSHGRDPQKFVLKQGLDKTFLECEQRMWRIGDRHFPQYLTIDGGSDWIALSRSFISYATSNNSDYLVTGLLRLYNYTLLPAESFFHVLLRNSYFCHTYVNNNLHVTNWKRKLGCKCQYKNVVDWCGCSPNDFRVEDWYRIEATKSKDIFFARKFEPIISQTIIFKLELWLFNIVEPTHNVTNLHGYWQNIFHYKDLYPHSDNTFLTFSTAATRIWLKNYTARNKTLSLQQIFSISNYHFNDSYTFTLIHFSSRDKTSKKLYNFEIAVKPIALTSQFSVSSDFDKKEQMSRNFPRLLSPLSDLYFLYKFERNFPTNLTCLWINPLGKIVEISEFHVNETGTTRFVKSHMKPPHLPGKWLVKIKYNETFIIKNMFLIMPFSNEQNIIYKESYSEQVSAYEKNAYKSVFNRYVSRLNPKINQINFNDWIDHLFLTFYSIVDACSLEMYKPALIEHISICRNTNWSSFALDPKSDLNSEDIFNNAFKIW